MKLSIESIEVEAALHPIINKWRGRISVNSETNRISFNSLSLYKTEGDCLQESAKEANVKTLSKMFGEPVDNNLPSPTYY